MMCATNQSSPLITEKPPRKRFKPDWEAIRDLVRVVSIHCTDIADVLQVSRQTLANACKKTFGKPWPYWARDVRKQAGIPTLFSPADYKSLLIAYHSGSLHYRDKHDSSKPKTLKGGQMPSEFGPTTGTPLIERLSYYQVDQAVLKVGAQKVWLGESQVSAGYPLAVWLDAKRQNKDYLALTEFNPRPEKLCWELTPLGVSKIAECLILFHKQLDKIAFNPLKKPD